MSSILMGVISNKLHSCFHQLFMLSSISGVKWSISLRDGHIQLHHTRTHTHTHGGHETQSTTTYTKSNCIARRCPASNRSLVGGRFAIFPAGAPRRTSNAIKIIHKEQATNPSSNHDIAIFTVSRFGTTFLSHFLYSPLPLPDLCLLPMLDVPA